MGKPLRRNLKTKERKFIAYCEQYYFLKNKGFPTVEEAAEELDYSITEIQFFMQNRLVQQAFERRGLPWKTSGKLQSGELSPTQIAAVLTVMNFADDREPSEKLESLGVLPQQYFAWLEDKKFYEFANSVADRNLNKVRPEAITEFAKLVRQGDFQALKYYFEITGQFRNPEVQNVEILLQRVIEAVQRHVPDPKVLAAIAADLMGAAPTAEITADFEYTDIEQQALKQFVGGRG